MPMMVQSFIAKVRKLFAYDAVYAGFWLTAAIIVFFFPVMLGWQSLAETVPTFYAHPTPEAGIKTFWQVDGGWHTIDVIPLVRSEIRMLQEGIPPIWTPYTGGGEAPMASNAVNIYYPLRLAFFSLWDSARAFDWYFILRFFIAGLGMFLYARMIGLRRIVALWGGIAYAFTGYFLLYLTYSFLDVEALIPWTLLAIEYFSRKPDVMRAACIGILLSFIILVGQPQSAIIAFLFLALYFAWNAARRESKELRSKNDAFSIIRYSLFVILIALLVAAPFIADFLTSWSQGGTVAEWETKGFAHFPPLRFLHFIVSPTMMPEVAFAGHLLDRFETIVPYLGLSVLLLFLASIFLRKKPFPLAPLYAWIGFVVLKNAGFPLLQWLGSLPILNQVGWYKAYGMMAGAIVICGAIAFERILQDETAILWRRFYKWLFAIPAAFLALYLLAPTAFLNAYVPNFNLANRNPELLAKITKALAEWPSTIRDTILSALQNHPGYFTLALFAEATVLAGFALAILYVLRRGRHRERAAVCMALLTAFELWLYMPKIRDGFRYFDPYVQPPPYVHFLENTLKEESARTISIGDVLKGHAGELYTIPKAQNNSPVKPRRYLSFLPEIMLREDPSSGTLTPEMLSRVPQQFFDAFSIRYLLSETVLPAAPWGTPIYDDDIKIYENKNALPKAYIVFRKETVVSPEAARDTFYEASFDPHSAVVLEDTDAVPVTDTDSPSHNGAPWFTPAHVTKYLPNEVMLQTTTNRDGVLVLTDTFYPGWHAYVDGALVPIYPANVLFRGIFLPRGAHTVRFAYEPVWFWPSVTLSILTILGVIGVLVSKKRILNF